MAAMGAAGAVLAACAPAAPTEAPKPTAAPTTAPAASTKAPAATQPAATVPPAPAATVPPKQAVTLSFWYFADDPFQASLHTGLIDKFMAANSGITVKAEMVNPVADMYKKMMTAFAAGSGYPDTCEGQSGWIAELDRAKVLPDYESRLKTWKYFADWQPSVVELSRGNKPGSPVGILTNKVQVQYTYIRTDWLKEAGLKAPETQEDLVKVAGALAKPPDRYGIGLRSGDTGFWGFQLANYLRGNGVQIINPDGVSTDLDSADAIATVDWFASWYTKLKITQPSVKTDKYPELFAQLQNSKLALFEHGIWSYKTMETALKDTISAIPKVKGSKGRFVPCSTEGPMFFKTTKNPDEAWKLISFMAEPDATAMFCKERGAGPTYKSQQSDPFFKENRFFQAALGSAPDWGQVPYHKNGTKMNDLLVPEFQLLLDGKSTAEKFCKTLAKALREE
jgi:multiple sugar transport system substrate-binding protein